MAKELKVVNLISINGAEPVPLESLSDAELERVRKIWGERIGRAMSDYYAQHPDEYRKLLEGSVKS